MYISLWCQVYEYNDKEDVADLTDKSVKKLSASGWNIIDLSQLVWDDLAAHFDPKSHALSWVASNKTNKTHFSLKKDGALSFQVID